MKSIILAILIYCMVSPAHATPQVPELLDYDGDIYDMYAVPLEIFFSDSNPRPQAFREPPPSSACWRGYVGHWRIHNGELWLVRLLQGYPSRELIPLHKVDPNWTSPVKAAWFTEFIRIGKGRFYESRRQIDEKHKKVILLQIVEGNVISIEVVDNEKKRKTGKP